MSTSLPQHPISFIAPEQLDQTRQTKRAQSRTIHIRRTFWTSSQSSPLHNQPSRTFDLLHATLQQNDCTSSSRPVTPQEHQGQLHCRLRKHWKKKKLCSSYQNGSQASQHRMTLNMPISEKMDTEDFSYSCDPISEKWTQKISHTAVTNFRENGHRRFPIQLWPNFRENGHTRFLIQLWPNFRENGQKISHIAVTLNEGQGRQKS